MSVIPLTETLKNTIEVFNGIYDTQNGDFPWFIFLKFLWTQFEKTLISILSFQWIHGFQKLPIFLPQISESLFADFVQYLQPMDFQNGSTSLLPIKEGFLRTSFISGFFNCLFLYLPFSPAQFIWIRRLVINGVWAGRAAATGIILGYLSFLGCCLFGLRDFIYTWYGLEPLSYFLGVWLIFIALFQMIKGPFKRIQKSQTKELLRIFLISFGCVWTDQSSFYQIFGNLSLQSGVSALDWTFGTGHIAFQPIWFYFLGLLLGSFLWTFLIGQGLLELGYLFPRFTRYKYSSWVRSLNTFCLIGCMTLTFTSFPYYGFGYLFSNPLGFVPQDRALETFSLLKTDTQDVRNGRLGIGSKSSNDSIDTDLSIFDRGRYAGGPEAQLDIESLNYQEEYVWRARMDRISARRFRKRGGLFHQYLMTQLGPTEEAIQKQKREKRRIRRLQKFEKLQQQRKSEEEQRQRSIDLDSNPIELNIDNEDVEKLIERFIENYTAEANTEDTEIPNLPKDQMIRFSAFSEIVKFGFDFFSMIDDFNIDPVEKNLAQEIKEKYSENFIYRFLVSSDISSFLKRQPQSHYLTSDEEIELFAKRRALGDYYETLRSYSELPMSELFRSFFCGPKSYSNRIYNQQFKGTLKVVERLFSIHLENKQNLPTLEKNPSQTKATIEQEKPKNASTSENKAIEDLYLNFIKEPSVLKFDQPLYNPSSFLKNPMIHEEFLQNLQPLADNVQASPFLQEATPLPFFVGWDHEQRKFVVTNRLLTREKTFQKTLLPTANSRSWRTPWKTRQQQPRSYSFSFTTWPVMKEAFQKNTSRLFRTREETPSQDDLFFYTEPLMEQSMVIYSTLPSLIDRLELENPDKLQLSLTPQRGGLIWPGNLKSKYQFQKIFQKWQSQLNFKTQGIKEWSERIHSKIPQIRGSSSSPPKSNE